MPEVHSDLCTFLHKCSGRLWVKLHKVLQHQSIYNTIVNFTIIDQDFFIFSPLIIVNVGLFLDIDSLRVEYNRWFCEDIYL